MALHAIVMAFLLCPYSVGALRDTQDDGSRPRRRFPAPPWLLQRAGEVGKDISFATTKQLLSSPAAATCPVAVRVVPGYLGDKGFLNTWDPEAEVLWEYFQRPRDAFTARMADIVVLDQPVLVGTKRKQNGEFTSAVRLSVVPVFRAGVMPELSTARCFDPLRKINLDQRLGQLLDTWRAGHTAPLECYWLPEPVVQLVQAGQWRTLLFSASWKSSLPELLSWPPRPWFQALRGKFGAKGALQSDSSGAKLSVDKLDRMKQLLCKWAPHIEKGLADDEDGSTEMFELERMVVDLTRLSRSLQPLEADVAQGSARRSGGTKWLGERLMKSVIVAFRLASHKDLATLLDEAVDLIVPACLADVVKDDCRRHAAKQPSAASVQRAQLTVDLAYMKHVASRRATSRAMLFCWADSSPQAGEDWFISSYLEVEVSSVAAVLKCVHALQASVGAWHTAFQLDSRDPAREGHLQRISKERVACTKRLSQLLRIHKQIPVAIGHRAAGLESKTHALLHALSMETPPTLPLQHAADQIMSITADLGVEVGISEASGGGVGMYLPAWRASTLQPDPEEPSADETQQPLRHALLMPGALHVIDNMEHSMDKHLQNWDWFIEGLSALTNLLGNKHTRERFLAMCIRSVPEFKHHEPLFRTNTTTTVKWRWGSVCQVLGDILRLRGGLVEAWSPQRYMQGFKVTAQAAVGEGQQQPGDNDPLDLELLTRTVQSARWWTYAFMLQVLHGIAKGLRQWMEGCYCHGWLHPRDDMTPEAEELHRVLKGPGGMGFEYDGSNFQCPLSGLRAVELAIDDGGSVGVGHLAKVIRAICATKSALLLEPCAGLSNIDRAAIIDDFEVGTASMQHELVTKLRCWQTLTWKLGAICHHATGIAKRAARSLIAEFDRLPADPVLHHPLTVQILGGGSIIRRQLEEFAAGDAPLAAYPEAQLRIGAFAFMSTAERRGEADHAYISKKVGKRKVSGPFVSLALRMPLIRSFLGSDTESFCRMCNLFEAVRNPKKAMVDFGLSRHPLLREGRLANASYHDMHKRLHHAVYSTASDSKFQEFSSTRQRHAARRAQTDRKVRAHFPQKKLRVTQDNVRLYALADHCRQRLRLGALYSLRAGAAPMAPVTAALAAAPAPTKLGAQHGVVQPSRLMPDVSDIALHDEADPVPDRGREIHFRLLKKSAGKAKLVRLPAAESRKLGASSMAVTLDKVVPAQGGEQAVYVSAEPANAVALVWGRPIINRPVSIVGHVIPGACGACT